jgi:hypothetical protein
MAHYSIGADVFYNVQRARVLYTVDVFLGHTRLSLENGQ